MPKPDGSLYWYEKEKEAKKAAGVAKAAKVVAEPIPFTDPVPKEKKKPGRDPSKNPLRNYGGRPKTRISVTPELIEAIVKDVTGGLPIESACVLQGISRDAVDKWRKANPAINAKFVKAEASFEQEMVGRIKGFANDDLKAAAWLLERRLARSWAPIGKTEITGKDGGAIQQTTLSKQLLGSVAGKGDPKLMALRSA